MAFILRSGNVQIDWFPKVASTAITNAAALIPNASGFATVAAAASTRILGISMNAYASTDATTPLIPVIVPGPDATFEATVTTGTLTTAMIGNAYDLASSVGIDVTGTSHKQVTVVGFISSSVALVKFNGSYQFSNAA